jgi:hypothetical protein
VPDKYNISGIAAQTVTIGDGVTVFAGDGGTVNQINHAEASALLAELQQAIEAFQGPPEKRAELMKAHDEISEDLQGPSPSKDKLLAKLSTLKQLAGPSSSILQVVAALMPVVSALV